MPPTDSAPRLDLAAVRSAFPSLDGEWVFMDNAGGSQCLGRVADRIRDDLLHDNVQLGATYAPSVRASERLRSAQASVARWVGADDPDEVVFGPSTTQLMVSLSSSYSRFLQPGDEVVVTDVDHEANIGPWRRLEDAGVVVREWPVDLESFTLRASDLEPLLGPRTKLVCFTATSNLLGALQPMAELVDCVHAHGARTCVDAVALAPHRLPDVRAWDVDLLAFSTYKTFGPHLGVLHGKRALLEELPGINHFFVGEDQVPYKFQPGNPNYELAGGAGEITGYLAELGGGDDELAVRRGYEAIAAHEERLTQRLLEFLNARGDVRVWGPTAADAAVRVPTVSFTVDGRSSRSVIEHLDGQRIGARHGHFYAHRLVARMGLPLDDGVVRVSLVHYNTEAEVDRLLAALDEAL